MFQCLKPFNIQYKPSLVQLEVIYTIACCLGEETNPHLTTTSWHILPFGPSKPTGCWQHNFRLLKKYKRENTLHKENTTSLNYRTLFLLSSIFSGAEFLLQTSHRTAVPSTGSTHVPYRPKTEKFPWLKSF